ncbi:Beta-1,3-glucan-binding protein [Amphibalanus amphitrite]|uniref:Beta-1,3-glucan-binding protein n=1 Tax=Amphibalanus amphitrite TaxID=1232801 RepID=A0A6A4WTK9_AMPAM|nr:Beta-1,3-glucan-binding protein [Amphibalanus amphitrite]
MFAALLLSAGLAATVSSELSVTTYNGGKTATAGELIFEDNFDELDLVTWQHELTLWGGGNNEFEGYNNNRTNSYIRDGVLYLRPTLTAERFGEDFLYSGTLDMNGGAPYDQCTCPLNYGCVRQGNSENILNPIMSAAMRTPLSFSFKYGRVEARAKMPAGDWIWPAIWMMPVREVYGNWPTSGEIDIVESRGNRDLLRPSDNVQVGVKQVASTMHWGADFPSNQWPRTHYELNDEAGFDADFHVYGVEWTPEGITFSVDGADIGSVTPPEGGFWELGEFDQDTWRDNPWQGRSKMAPFDQEFYLKLNVAVGGTGVAGSGTFFEDSYINGNGAKPWNNTSPTAYRDFWEGRDQWLPSWNGDDTAMQVDYVRVYAL